MNIWVPDRRLIPPRPNTRLRWSSPIVSRGLLYAWPMNDGVTGVARDAFKRGRDITLNSISGITNFRGIAPAYQFNGTSSYASVAVNLSGAFTLSISFWLRVDTYNTADDLAMELTTNFNSFVTGLIIDPCSSTGAFSCNHRGNGGYNDGRFTRPSVGEWHFYTVIFDHTAAGADEISAYVDGVLQSLTKTNSADNPSSDPFANDTLYIMTRTISSLYLHGSICNLLIHDRALTLAEHYQMFMEPYDSWMEPEPFIFGGATSSTTPVSQTCIGCHENLQGILAPQIGCHESLQAVAASGAACHENLEPVTASAIGCHENLQGVLSPGTGCIESLQAILATGLCCYESLQLVTAPAIGCHENLEPVLSTQIGCHESLQGILAPQVGCHENLQGITAPCIACHENTGEAASGVTAPCICCQESLAPVVASQIGCHENLASVLSTQVGCHENLQGILAPQVGCHESIGRIVAPWDGCTENLAPVVSTLAACFESLLGVTSTQVACFESLGRVVSFVIACQEVLGPEPLTFEGLIDIEFFLSSQLEIPFEVQSQLELEFKI